MLANRDSMMWELCGNDIEKASGRTSFNAMRAGDKAGKEVVEEYIDYLTCGLVNIINIFQPEILSIGGGISGEGDFLLNLINEPLSKFQYSARSDKQTKVVIAKLGNEAGIIGAAYLRK